MYPHTSQQLKKRVTIVYSLRYRAVYFNSSRAAELPAGKTITLLKKRAFYCLMS
jgi:hypothetical protein